MKSAFLNVSALISLWNFAQSFVVLPASQSRAFSRATGAIQCRSNIPLLIGPSKATTALFMSYDPSYPTSPSSSSLSPEDMEVLKEYFSKRCDTNALMSKQDVMVFPAISQLLKEDDISMEEFQEIWDSVPKSTKSSKNSIPPTNSPSTLAKSSVFEKRSDRIDWDSFVQIYREIDDLFEDTEEDDVVEDGNYDVNMVNNENTMMNDIPNDDNNISTNDNKNGNIAVDELAIAFNNLCNSPLSPPKRQTKRPPRLSKNELRAWEEIDQLILDGMLGEDEFELLWKRTIRQQLNQGQSENISLEETLDLNGFIVFNEALDDLFVFEDEEEEMNVQEEENIDVQNQSPSPPPLQQQKEQPPPEKTMIEGEYLPPAVLFSLLADDNFLVGMDDLYRWGELVEMLDEGDLLPEELESIFQNTPKAPGTMEQLNEDGFVTLYNAIDALFEDTDDADNDNNEFNQESPSAISTLKETLLNLVNSLNQYDPENGLLPCGLECTEQEQAQILQLVNELEMEPQNVCLSKGGQIQMDDLAGSWDLLYTSSGMMKFNKGLTGLGGTFPSGRFGGLRQNLIATKYITDVEYIERIEVVPEQNSFDAIVNGDWELKSSVSLFTGAPSTIISVEPEKVMYGPTTTRADHWKSVRSMNLLDLSYLDEDLRIMRGNTSTDTLFIFRRAD